MRLQGGRGEEVPQDGDLGLDEADAGAGTCQLLCHVCHIHSTVCTVRAAGHSVPGHSDLNCVSTLAMPRLKNSVQLFKTLSLR